jgi:hypothetical protein
MRYAFPLVLALLFSLLPVTPALAQGGPCDVAPRPRGDMTYALWSGEWHAHGQSLTVMPQGCGVASWRLYERCPASGYNEACDPVVGHEIQHGGYTGFILNARDGRSASGKRTSGHGQRPMPPLGIVLTLNDDGTLTAEWDNEPRTFCRTWAWIPDVCGA